MIAYENCFIATETDAKRIKYALSDQPVDNHVVILEMNVDNERSQKNPDGDDDGSENFDSNSNAMQELLEKHVDCNNSPYEGPYMPLRKVRHLSTLKGKNAKLLY